MVPGFKLFVDFADVFLYLKTMTNDFSNIPAESNLRDEMTVRSDEQIDHIIDMASSDLREENVNPIANPAYDGPMGIMTDYDGCDSADEGENTDDEGTVTEPDESMDGDFDSGMASAGFGTDEDFGYYGGNEN